MALSQKFRSLRQKPINRLWALYGLFAAFLILDGLFYLLSPYSGRISTLVCEPVSADQSSCTVTIYGFRQIYKHAFMADEFIEALVIHNYTGDSADTTYGITLLTTTGKVNFIHPYQPWKIIQNEAQQVNDLFVDTEPAPDMSLVFVGFNYSLYMRLLLLVMGLLFVLYRSRKTRLKTETQPVTQLSFWRFSLQWFVNNLLVRLFFYLVILLITLSGCTRQYSLQTDLVMGCHYIPYTRHRFFDWTTGYLLCFYPLLVILLLKTLVQRQMLNKVKISVSHLWIIAPFLAAPFLILVSPRLYCEDCLTLKYLLAGILEYDSPLMIGLMVYFVILGLLQWLALRKTLAASLGWAIMPLVNAMLVVLARIGYRAIYASYWRDILNSGQQIPIRLMLFYLPALLVLLAILISEIIPALYISWLLKRRTLA